MTRRVGKCSQDIGPTHAIWLPLRASDVGAPHRRERLFIIAWRRDVGPGRVSNADGEPLRQFAERQGLGACATDERDAESRHMGAGLADADRSGLEERGRFTGDARQECAPAQRGGDSVGDAASIGWGEGRAELSGREREPAPVVASGPHEWPPSPDDFDGWAEYLARHPGRAPAVINRRGAVQLNPGFVEALMGFPDGWTEGHRRGERLKMLGNAVVPQLAESVGLVAGSITQ